MPPLGREVPGHGNALAAIAFFNTNKAATAGLTLQLAWRLAFSSGENAFCWRSMLYEFVHTLILRFVTRPLTLSLRYNRRAATTTGSGSLHF